MAQTLKTRLTTRMTKICQKHIDQEAEKLT